jgi:hypothetical protein
MAGSKYQSTSPQAFFTVLKANPYFRRVFQRFIIQIAAIELNVVKISKKNPPADRHFSNLAFGAYQYLASNANKNLPMRCPYSATDFS